MSEKKLKMFKVRCTKENCENSFYVFRADSKVPVKDIKCLDCEMKERVTPTRELSNSRGSKVTVIVGSNDACEKPLVRCE